MAKKAAQGAGTISKRKDGTWWARVTVGVDAIGNQKRQAFYGRSQGEVLAKMQAVQNSIRTGTFIEPSKITVCSWLDTWLWDYKKQSVKPKTFESYEGLIRLHIKPAIGHILLKTLRPDQVQKMVTAIKDKIPEKTQKRISTLQEKLKKANKEDKDKISKEIEVLNKDRISARTVEYTHKVLHGALEQALKNGLIVRNVSESVTLPKRVKKEILVLATDEQKKLIKSAKKHRIGPAIILTLFTGLRIGELLALKWEDIDLKTGILKVNRIIQRIKTYSESGPKTMLVESTPKSEKGKRSIPLLGGVVSLLEKHQTVQSAEKMKAGPIYQDSDYVFCKEDGTVYDVENFEKIYYKLIESAGIRKINFHALRHTFATRGLENGIDLKVMQEILGHSTLAMTADTYTHVLPEKKRDSINKLKYLYAAASK